MTRAAGITSWAWWTSSGTAARTAPPPGLASGPLRAWAEAPPLSAIHPRARRPHPAAKVLVQLASLVLGERRLPALGLLLGSASGSAGADREFDRELAAKGQGFGSPSLFVYTLPTAPLGEVSIALEARGPLLTVSAGAAAGLSAVALAIEWVETGSCGAVLCGSFEHGVADEELVLFLLEADLGRKVTGSSGFSPTGSARAPGALQLASALSHGAGRSITSTDPLGFCATVEVSPA